MQILVGDVGGTKTELSLREGVEDGLLHETRRARFSSSQYQGLGAVIREFIKGSEVRLAASAFGVAGPVVNQVCKTTNLPWIVDATALSKELGAPVGLINDFHAVALGISSLGSTDLAVLQAGTVDPGGPIAIIGAGTGLGEAVVVPTSSGPLVIVSEGGHADFPARNSLELGLLSFLQKRFGRVSVERVVSGPGLAIIYQYLITEGGVSEHPATREALVKEDPGKVIGESALAGTDPGCARAVEVFMSAYGAEAGNLALKTLPSGGLYVAGGIAPVLLPKMRDGGFIRAFLDKGRMAAVLERIRVSVIMNKHVALLGAQNHALALAHATI